MGSLTSTIDHGTLTGLADDDHTGYVLRSILTTRGDLPVRGASDWTRLGVGGANTVLTANGTDPAWSATPTVTTLTTTGLLTTGAGLTVNGGALAVSAASYHHVIGGAVDTTALFFLRGATEAGTSYGFATGMNLQPGASADSALVNIGGYSSTIVEAASGTHDSFAGLLVQPPTITPGDAGLTNAASLKITNAPTGATNNYALWSDAGLNRFDGDGTYVFELPADATDPTGGGGAGAGRIAVKIGGATKYLAYY